jgi:hypothetical protein
VVQETAVPVADISAMTKVQAEYDSLLERWHAAYAGSQEIADLHATFKARAQGVGRLVENGLFKRILAALAPTPPAVEAPNPKGQTK